MRLVVGAGCWPGRAEGPVYWLASLMADLPPTVEDRTAEVLRFRHCLSQAQSELDRWCDQQPTLEGRLLLQQYQEALHVNAWTQRTCALIDTEGTPASTAVVNAARILAPVLSRSDRLQELATALSDLAEWIAFRLAPPMLSGEAIFAAERLSPLLLLDRRHPALVAAPQPPVAGVIPLVWGVPGLGPDWHGRRVRIEGANITLDVPDPKWWKLDGDHLRGMLVVRLDGDPATIRRVSGAQTVRPVAWIHRLEDLAAVPLLIPAVGAVAIDLERIAQNVNLLHPGFERLLSAAMAALQGAEIPLLASGSPVLADPAYWLSRGFTALVRAS